MPSISVQGSLEVRLDEFVTIASTGFSRYGALFDSFTIGGGVAGVGWNLGHRTMRVTDNTDGTAPISFLTNAARTAILAGDRVSSVSYSGGTGNSVNTAGTFIRSNGGLLVWAAGNASQVLGGSREDPWRTVHSRAARCRSE